MIDNGVAISEEQAAGELGFASVQDLRRWQTELGHKCAELEYALKKTKNDVCGFQWHLRRMTAILERCGEVLDRIGRCGPASVDPPVILKLILATRVVCGRGVDWDHLLDDWLGDIKPEPGPWVVDGLDDYVI